MLDKKWLQNNYEAFEISSKKRTINDYKQNFTVFQELNSALRKIVLEQETVRAAQNRIIGASQEASALKTKVAELSHERDAVQNKLDQFLLNQPNILLEEVPYGLSEADNKVIFSTQIPISVTMPHNDLIEHLVMKEEAAMLSGSRFVLLKHALSKLKRVLTNWMITSNAQEGYEEYTVPYLVNEECLYGSGQLPKFAEDAFKTTHGKWLISTGEIALVNMFRNYVFASDDLPKLCMTFSPCFRSEAGAAGKDTKGLIRLHQFHKLELVTLCRAEDAEIFHEKQLNAAKKILNALKLPYRILLLCGADTGFTATKQYDIEVWMPGMQRFLEIASCSQCGEFQARRANIRYKNKATTTTTFVHTLNGSSLPIERLLAAIIENYANQNGSITIPDVLVNEFCGSKILNSGSIV